MIAVLLVLAVAALAIPTLATAPGAPDAGHAQELSVFTAVVLLVLFAASIPFSIAGGPGASALEAPVERGLAAAAGGRRCSPRRRPARRWSRTGSSTALEPSLASLGISEAFAGLVVVAIAGNAVENVVGIQLAVRNKVDLAISLILNSSLQVALALTPALVLISLVIGGPALTLVLTPLLLGSLGAGGHPRRADRVRRRVDLARGAGPRRALPDHRGERLVRTGDPVTITAGAVAGFLPSTAGFHFANRWPAGPALRFEVRVPGPVPVGVALAIGEVANGLCGGMALAAIDRFVRGEGPPPDREPPAPGTPLFGEIVRRQVDSLELGLAVARFYRASAVGDAVRARIAVRDAWPGVRRAVDGGRPAAVGLIHAASADPRRLIGNHQVVAYGYELEASAGRVSLAIYDPNRPRRRRDPPADRARWTARAGDLRVRAR